MKYLSLITLMVAASCSEAMVILMATNITYLAYNAGAAIIITLMILLGVSGIVLFIMFYKEWNYYFNTPRNMEDVNLGI